MKREGPREARVGKCREHEPESKKEQEHASCCKMGKRCRGGAIARTRLGNMKQQGQACTPDVRGLGRLGATVVPEGWSGE